MIKGTEWEDLVFPTHKSPDEKLREKILNALEEKYEARAADMESIFNEALFNGTGFLTLMNIKPIPKD